MRLPDSAHFARPWRIHEIAAGFRLEDVWALATPGGPDDFPRLVEQIAGWDPARAGSAPARALFAIRDRLGRVLGWDEPQEATTLRDRVPADLRGGPPGPEPFRSLYLTEDEWALEVANRTVHGVLHVGWVPDGEGAYRGQLAILVKRNGLLGTAYMAAISPFRHLIVYPPLLRGVAREWRAAT